MRCAEIKRVLSDIFLFKNLNEALEIVETLGNRILIVYRI
jgi:hypothetical protein